MHSKLIAQKIELLNKATLDSLNKKDKLQVVKSFTETAVKIFGADFAFAWWKLGTTEDYSLAYKTKHVPYDPNPPRKHGGNYRAQTRLTPVFVPDVLKEHYEKEYDVRPYMRSYAIIPIVYNERSYGNIVICFKNKKVFSNEIKSLCAALGNAMAQAITINALYSDLAEFKSTLDNTLDCIFMFDPRTFKFVYVNKGGIAQVGYTRRELLTKTIFDVQYKMSEETFKNILAPLAHGKNASELFETTFKTKQGTKIPVELFLQYVKGPEGQDRFMTIARDITDRKKAEETIKQTAYQDTLTKLPNRLNFNERIKTVYEVAKKNKQNFAFILLDLDRFKFINDILGHMIGDKLLYEAAQRIRSSVKRRDFVARLGGDEFIILLEKIKTEDEVLSVAQRIQENFKKPFNLDSHEIYVNISAGVSIYPDDGKDISTLFKNADSALYRAKEQGGNNFQQYSEDSFIAHASHLEIDKGLRNALKYNELVLHYQPQIDMKTGRIVGCEALVRWNHPELGIMYPSEFISHAEESSLIIPMGEWILEEACRQNKAWQDAGLAYIPVSVNVSPKQLLQKTFVDTMNRVLKETELDPHYLEIEIIEDVVMKNIEMSIEILQQFKDMGIKVMVDDFGTGYASLSYLKRLPIDTVKIDRTFIDGSLTNSDDAALVVAIISIAHQLRLKVIAEGVETPNQYNFLASHNCDYMQGYIYSKPLSAEAMTKLLKSPPTYRLGNMQLYTLESK